MMLRFCGAVSILFFLACELAPGLLMHIFTHDAPLIAIGSSYLRIAGWSYLLTGISQCYLTMMKVSDHVKPGALISSCAVLLNICLNAVFIFGLLGAPKMQARGAALATTISRIVELLLCIAVSSNASYIRPAFGRFLKLPKLLKSDSSSSACPLWAVPYAGVWALHPTLRSWDIWEVTLPRQTPYRLLPEI